MEQTAVQYLFDWIDANIHEESFNINDAKELSLLVEKNQIAKAYETGWINGDLKKAPNKGENYYEETYEDKTFKKKSLWTKVKKN